MVLTAQETRGVWSLIPACATPNADELEARDTVDVDKLAAMVERLIQAGVDGIATTGTLGEGHAALGRAPEADPDRRGRGAQARADPDGHDEPEYAADAREGALGGVGGLRRPAERRADVAAAVLAERRAVLQGLAEAMPNMAIMIYHNPPVPRHHPAAGWKQLAQVRNIVAVKQTVTEMRHWISVRDAVGQNITILVSDNVAWPTAMFGAGGVWSTRSSGARSALRLWRRQPRRLAARGGDPARAVRHVAAGHGRGVPYLRYADDEAHHRPGVRRAGGPDAAAVRAHARQRRAGGPDQREEVEGTGREVPRADVRPA